MKEREKVCVGCKGGGGQNQDKISADGAALRKLMRMHDCIHTRASVCVCARVCCDMPISSTPNSTTYPSSMPPSYCPTPDPTLLISAGPAAKTGMRGGTVFHPCGGQSLWIRQPNLGPSPLGSCAQQAFFSPPEDGGL